MKILLADDDAPIRRWIRQCIENIVSDDTTILEVANGKQALKAYFENKPDLLVTDIRMPIIDGLQLVKQIKQADTDTKIIIVTGFQDFEYAREAIKYGVNDYMLKDEISVEKMKNVFNLLQVNINKENSLLDKRYLKRFVLLSETVNDINIWNNLTYEGLRQYGIRLKEGYFVVFAIRISDELCIDNEIFGPTRGISNISICVWDKNYFLVIANVETHCSSGEKRLRDFAELCIKEGFLSVGISGVEKNIKQLKKSITDAIQSAKHRFYSPDQKIFGLEHSCVENGHQQWQEALMAAYKFVFSNEIFAASDAIQDAISIIYKEQPEDTSEIKMQIKQLLNNFCMMTLPDTDSIFSKISSGIDTLSRFSELAEECIIKVKSAYAEQAHYSEAIMLAVEYINKNYKDPINLASVASHVHLNQDYLSRIFKEEVNRNLSDYINQLRLSRSLDLLADTNLRICEVASEVGYSNTSYFSVVFKKMYGMSPFSYRKIKLEKNE